MRHAEVSYFGLMVDTLAQAKDSGSRQAAGVLDESVPARRMRPTCAARWKPVMAIGHRLARQRNLRGANGVSAGLPPSSRCAGWPDPVLARQWPLRAPCCEKRSAVLSSFSAGIAIASRLLMRPRRTPYDQLRRRGRPPRLAAYWAGLITKSLR